MLRALLQKVERLAERIDVALALRDPEGELERRVAQVPR
jgi:hypothetical protein